MSSEPGWNPERDVSRRRAVLEILAALVSAVIHFATSLGGLGAGVDQLVLGVGWIGYVVYRAYTPGVLEGWGLRREGLHPTLRVSAIALVIGAAACAVVGIARDTLAVDFAIVPLLVLYPLWGLVQQLIVLGIVAGNLDAFGLPRAAIVAIAATGFAAVHVPDWPLCAATLVLGAFAALVFLRWRNLWPLGVLHGLLGAVFYRWVLDRDPWTELVT